jgi:hypothetical protein
MKLTLFSGETISIKMSQWEPPAPDDEDAAPSYTPSVTYLHISSSQADHPINSLMDRLAFKASSYTFTGIPIEISEVADLPEEEPEEPEVSDQTSPTPATQETAETVEELVEQKASAQPQIKQHIDGNSVIFEVIPAKKDGEESPAPEETKPEKN